MGKIINPVSYKKMAESYAKPAYKLREGVGAGYELTFIDIKLTNVKVGKTEKDANGFDAAKFTADIVPGEYGWYADHPYWTAASRGNPEPYNFDSSMNPFSSKAVITGGKVEGTCDDGGTAWRTEGSPWSEEQFIDEIESETFVIQDSYSGGWSLSPMTDTLEWENEVRPGYEKYIDDTPSERGNLAVIEKISFKFDPDWVMDYNEAVDYAMNPDEEDWYEEDEWDDADDDESPAFYDDPDTGRQWYESRRHPDTGKWKKGDWVIYKGKRYVTSMFLGGDMVKLESPNESIVVPQSEVYKATKKDIYNESKMRESHPDYLDRDIVENTRYKSIIDAYDKNELGGIIRDGNVFYIEHFPSKKVEDLVKKEVKRLYPDLKYLYDLPRPKNWRESKMKESKSEDIKYLKYLLRKEEVTALDKEERWELQDLISKYGYPEEEDEEDDFYVNPEDYDKEGTYEEYLRYCDATNGDPMSEEEWRWTTGIYESKKSGKSRLNEGFGWGHENLPHPEGDPDVDAFAYPEKGDTVKIYKTNTSSVGEMVPAKVYYDRFNACGQLGKVKDVYYQGGVPSDYLVEVLTGESKGCELRLPQESVHLYVGGKDALKEYTVKDWYEENPSKEAHTKADPLDRYYAIQVKEVNPEYRRYFHHTADVGDFWAGSAFTFVDEFSDAELYETPKKAEEALKEVNDAMDRLAKHKRFEGRPYEFEIVGGYKNVLTERIHKKTYSDHIVGYTEPGEDEEIFYDRKHAGYVSDGQAYIRKDCPKEVYEIFPDYIETNLSFLEESKLKEDILASQVRQSVLDVQAAKKQVDEDVAVLDRKVDKVSNDLVRVATNRRDVISEAKTRFVELDSPLKISDNGKIDEIEVKKILRKLAADRILRVNAHYNIKDSEGKVTYWDFLHSQYDGYQYVFVQEMTGNYCYSNMLYLNKRRGKIDLKNTKWSSYEIPEDCYDRYKMTEASRLTHRIVLKPEDSGYRLTHADKLRFHSKEDAESKLSQMNASMGSRLASKGLHLEIEEIPYTPKPRNTRTQDPDYENPFEVGDILEGDFGYSMILPVWVQVVSKTAKTVTVRRLEDKVISHDGYGQAGTKLPIPNSFSKGWGDSYEEQRCIVKKGYRTGESDPKKRYFIDFQGKMMNIWDGEARDFDTYD